MIFLKKLILLFLAAVSLFCITEIVVRYIEPKTVPSYYVVNRDVSERLFLPEKQADEYRVFVYGGSVAYGDPLPALSVFGQLEFWLERTLPEKRVVMYNFSQRYLDIIGVKETIADTVRHNPDCIIVLSGHNELRPPIATASVIPYSFRTSKFALFRFLSKLLLGPQLKTLEQYTRDSLEFASAQDRNERASRYKQAIKDIVQLTDEQAVPLVFCTVPMNLLWPPYYQELEWSDDFNWHIVPNEMSEEIHSCLNLIDADMISEGESSVEQLLSVINADESLKEQYKAMVSFLKGKILFTQGKYIPARGMFQQANDLDPLPRRALKACTNMVRRFSKTEGIYIADIDQIITEYSSYNIMGYEFFIDGSHLNIDGSFFCAQRILETLHRYRFFDPEITAINGPYELHPFLENIGFSEKDSPLKLDYLLTCGLLCMDFPNLNFEAAHSYIDDAIRKYPEVWTPWVYAAALALFEGDQKAVIEYLAKAAKLLKRPINRLDFPEVPILEKAARSRGL